MRQNNLAGALLRKKKDNKDKSVAIRNQKAAERNAVVPVSLKRDNAIYAGKFASLCDEEEEVVKPNGILNLVQHTL